VAATDSKTDDPDGIRSSRKQEKKGGPLAHLSFNLFFQSSLSFLSHVFDDSRGRRGAPEMRMNALMRRQSIHQPRRTDALSGLSTGQAGDDAQIRAAVPRRPCAGGRRHRRSGRNEIERKRFNGARCGARSRAAFCQHRSEKQCAGAAETIPGRRRYPSSVLCLTRGGVAAGQRRKWRRRHARSVMKLRVKADLGKVTLAAVCAAAVASPAPAQNWQTQNGRYANVPVSTDNALWGLAYAPLQTPAYGLAYGSAAGIRRGRPAPGIAASLPAASPTLGSPLNPLPRILDCVHVTFPQCGGVGGN
jgi:hypothetical protein